jgi:hypothetical protein
MALKLFFEFRTFPFVGRQKPVCTAKRKLALTTNERKNMSLPEVPVMKQRITQLIRNDEFRIAPRAVESFTNRLTNLNARAHQLPFEDRNALQTVLYAHLEQVLMRFEELEWLGPQSGPVPIRDRASDAIHAYGVRFDKIDERLGRLPSEQLLATSAVLHRELEAALIPFENHRSLRRRVTRNSIPQSRSRWN